MKKFALRLLLLLLVAAAWASPALAQSSPGWTYGKVPTAAEWNAAFAAKQDVFSSAPCLVSGCQYTGPIKTAPSTVSAAGLSVAPGVAPTSPTDGDMWVTTSGVYVRINGVTVGPLTDASTPCTACTITVNSVASLRSLAAGTAQAVMVTSYYGDGNGGGGPFFWKSTSTATDNGGSIIKPTATAPGDPGRWVRYVVPDNSFLLEMFGAKRDGTDVGPTFRSMMSFLGDTALGGNILLSCNSSYTVSTLTGDVDNSIVAPQSNVNIVGCGGNSKIKFADNVNTSSAAFANGIFTFGSASNARYAHFVIEANGVNNSCGGTCWHSNAMIGVGTGRGLIVDDVQFLNNPGSNDTVFGTDVASPTVSDLWLNNLYHYNSATAVNAAAADWSGDFAIATNWTLANSHYTTAGQSVSTPFEIHGINGAATNLVVRDYDTCGIVANENIPSPTINVELGHVTCTDVVTGPVVASKTGTGLTNINVHHVSVNFLSGNSGYGLDACTLMNSASGPNNNLSIDHITINSDVTTNLGNETPGICVSYWGSVKIDGADTTNTQGPGVWVKQHVNGDTITITNSVFKSPGRTATAANKRGVLISATGGTTSGMIAITNNYTNAIATSIPYGVENAQNATSGIILGNRAVGITSAQFLNSGTGVTAYALPGASGTFAMTDVGQTFTAVQRFNSGFFQLAGATSGFVTITPDAVASGTVSLTAGTYTLVGDTLTQTLSGKTFVAPALGAATGTSLALGGATLGGNALAVSGTTTFTSNSAAAVSVGPNGATNPIWQIDASTASAAAGLKLTGAATGGTVALAVVDGSNASLSINAAGTGSVTLQNVATGGIGIGNAPPTTGTFIPTVNINGNATAAIAYVGTAAKPQMLVIGPNSGNSAISFQNYNGQNVFQAYSAGGTAASPSATGNGINTFNIQSYTYDGTEWGSNSVQNPNANFAFQTSEAQSAGHHGMGIIFRTTPTASINRTTVSTYIAPSGGLSVFSTVDSGAGTLLLNPQTFASLTACSSTIKGALASVTDSNTATWGATIAGSGANPVLGYCDGTNWTVAGK